MRVADAFDRVEATGRAETVLRLMTLKLGPPAEDVVARVHAASAAELDRFVDRILVAASIDEVLAERAIGHHLSR